MSHTQYQFLLKALRAELDKVIIGYDHVKTMLVMALLADGNVLLRAVPGTGKTTLVNTLQAAIEGCQASRIQLTPDLKPSDLIGGSIWDPAKQMFKTIWGPVVENDHQPVNVLLADEINRTPGKTLSALLQPAQEHAVTIGDETRAMEELYVILATMNPVEQEGTYSLPEAMTDRFAVLLDMDYVTRQEEFQMLRNRLDRRNALKTVERVISIEQMLEMRKIVLELAGSISDPVCEYIVDVVRATRPSDETFAVVFGDKADELRKQVMYGASPRAVNWIADLAAANAFYLGENVVTIDNVKNVVPDVLNHRVILNPAVVRRTSVIRDIVTPILSKVGVTGGALVQK